MLDFLKDKFEKQLPKLYEYDINVQELNEINKKLKSLTLPTQQLKLIRDYTKYQIWSVRQEYYDFLGYKYSSDHPLIVIINMEPGEIEEESFARVFVVSPFLEFAASDDIICNDSSIIGFPFLIEYWNDQPVLTEILDEYLGDYKYEKPQNSDVILSKAQIEFRQLEISRAKYLNQSVASLLTFLENRQTKDLGVAIYSLGQQSFPQFYVGAEPKEPALNLAAKSGIDSIDRYLKYSSPKFQLELFFRKNDEGVVLTITPFHSGKLIDNKNNEIPPLSAEKKIVFEKLKKGVYHWVTEQIQEPIIIRIK